MLLCCGLRVLLVGRAGCGWKSGDCVGGAARGGTAGDDPAGVLPVILLSGCGDGPLLSFQFWPDDIPVYRYQRRRFTGYYGSHHMSFLAFIAGIRCRGW